MEIEMEEKKDDSSTSSSGLRAKNILYMKKLENKNIEFVVEQYDATAKQVIQVPIKTTYLELLFNCCKMPVEGGYSWDLIEKINRVKLTFDSNKENFGIVDIEDADFEFMKSKFLSNNFWTSYDINLLEMKKYIESLK